MGRLEAEANNIPFWYEHGHITYKVPCERCGKEIITKVYNQNKNYTCNYCRNVINKKKKALDTLDDVRTPREVRFDNAVEMIKKQVNDFEKYERPVEIARTRAEKYDSVTEAMVAIELIKLKFKIIPQQKVGRYHVDFALPTQKLIVEVDGTPYHADKEKDLMREAAIQHRLGYDWKFVRVPDEVVRSNIKLLRAILYKSMS